MSDSARRALICGVSGQDGAYLAGQSSVGLSFELPAQTLQSMVLCTLNLLEACRLMERPVRLHHAGSSECFGDTGAEPPHETTPFSPRSPYAVAKASAYWLVNSYRHAYGLFACTGILFNACSGRTTWTTPPNSCAPAT